MHKILFFGNGAHLNYVTIKYLRNRTNYNPDLLLQDYNHPIYDHPAWEDLPIKIPQHIIKNHLPEAKKILYNAIKDNNWIMPHWVKEKPIRYSLYDKFITKYIDNFYTIKKQIKHYINDLKNYDFVYVDGAFGAITALLANVRYAIRPFGSDVDIHAFENDYRGIMIRKALNHAIAIYARPYKQNLKKLGLENKPEIAPAIIDTEKLKPKKHTNKVTEFFLASRLWFEGKGTDKALKAFARLLSSNDAHLYCLEYGTDIQKTRSLVQFLGIEKNVTFYDFVASKPVLVELYNKHDAVIGNLNYGTIGLTELEALSCDKTVIAHSKLTSEYYNELPIMNSFSEDEIYSSMKNVCENRHLPTGMRDFILKYYSIDYFLQGFESVLKSI